SGTASAQVLWDRPNGSGGVTSNQVIPGSVMYLSESLAKGVNRTESATEDTRALGFQIFSNKESSGLLNVKLASTSDTSNSTVDNTISQRRTDNTKVGDDYVIYEDSTGGSQITAAVIGLNDSYGTLQWQPNKASGSLENFKSFYVQVLTDSYAEAKESVTLNLGSNTGYGVSNSNQTLSIGDSAIVLSVKAGQNPQEGGSNEADLGWFTVSTNNRPAPGGGIRVRYAIKGGTATRNADYTAPQSTLSTTSFKAEDLLVIPAGAMEAKIYIAALADAIREGDETVVLELQTNIETDDKNFKYQRYNVDSSASQATLTIIDSTSYSAAVVTTPADRTGLSTGRAQLSNGNQVASFD
ncbi:MAG: Calx-beta domain-containing protein, partial [bacterium]